MHNYHEMFPWLGGDAVKVNGETLKQVWIVCHNFISSGFSSKPLTKALMEGSCFHSDEFVSAVSKRIEILCQQSFTDDGLIDVQPVIRTITFNVFYGELFSGESAISVRSYHLIWSPQIWISNGDNDIKNQVAPLRVAKTQFPIIAFPSFLSLLTPLFFFFLQKWQWLATQSVEISLMLPKSE